MLLGTLSDLLNGLYMLLKFTRTDFSQAIATEEHAVRNNISLNSEDFMPVWAKLKCVPLQC
jgi:hypothetical protein